MEVNIKDFNDSIKIKAINNLVSVMGTLQGRLFVQWLIKQCGQENTSFTGNTEIYFNEGRRSIALIIEENLRETGLDGLNLLHQSEKDYIQHKQEIRRELEEKDKDKRRQ